MKVLTEADLRTMKFTRADREYHVQEGTFVTPSAREFLRDREIRLIIDTGILAAHDPAVNHPAAHAPAAHAAMTRVPIQRQGEHTYVDAATGEGYEEKPETMTHLRGNLLVPKTHPRIALRGSLDGLQAKVLLIQSKNHGDSELVRSLDSVLAYLRAILGAEVKDEPLGETLLFDLDHKAIRRMSHNVREIFGIDHPIPDRFMEEKALELNLLRTQVREAELIAADAFREGDTLNVIEHLNRLSSGIYILFCRVVSGHWKTDGL